MQNRVSHSRRIMGWLVSMGCSLLAGVIVGFGMMTFSPHIAWPITAGILVGITSALMARAHPVLMSVAGGILAVVSSTTTMVVIQYWRGFWPITDEDTIEHYGTVESAILRVTIGLLIFLLVPCLVAAVSVAFAKRRVVQRRITAAGGLGKEKGE